MDLRYDFETTIFYMNEGAIKEKALSDNYARTDLYIKGGDYLIPKITKHISPSEYRIFAYFKEMQVNYNSAKHYYEEALNNSQEPIDKAYSYEYLAYFYSGKFSGVVQNQDKAREYYNEAIKVLENKIDPYLVNYKAKLITQSAIFDLQCNKKAEAKIKLLEALKIFEKLPKEYNPDNNINYLKGRLIEIESEK